MIVYLNDGEWIQQLQKYPAVDHAEGEWLNVGNGKVKQVPHTYGRIGFQMNEKQVAIGETTFVITSYSIHYTKLYEPNPHFVFHSGARSFWYGLKQIERMT